MIPIDNFYRSHICYFLLKMTQRTCHSTAEILIFLTMQKLMLQYACAWDPILRDHMTLIKLLLHAVTVTVIVPFGYVRNVLSLP